MILFIIRLERPSKEAVSFPRKGVSEMSEIGAILFLVVATGYILAITQKK